jgi:hypothetical protein
MLEKWPLRFLDVFEEENWAKNNFSYMWHDKENEKFVYSYY